MAIVITDNDTYGGDWYSHDIDAMFEEIRHHTKDADEVEVSGDAEWLTSYHDVKEAA